MEVNNQLLSLVRLGIEHRAHVLPEPIRWEKIKALASEHGLSAIVLDGCQELADLGLLVENRAMDVTLKKQWIGTVIQNYEWKYEDYRKRIGQLA